jgi:hypothetical protein
MPAPDVAARICSAETRCGRAVTARRLASFEPVSGFLVSGISPPRALAIASSAFPHVSEKFNTRQDLKWSAVLFDCAATQQVLREHRFAEGVANR